MAYQARDELQKGNLDVIGNLPGPELDLKKQLAAKSVTVRSTKCTKPPAMQAL